MRSVQIYLADTEADGAVMINSPSSHFTAARIPKEEITIYENSLSMPGVYMLLIGNDTVYVGQSGLDTIKNRIVNTHSGNIDSSWHTVIGFCCVDKTIGNNELLFLENALCEYVHNNFPHCATTTPTKKNCNAKYRNTHYHLSAGAILNCNQYFHDIISYLKMIPYVFQSQPVAVEAEPAPVAVPDPEPIPAIETSLFYYRSTKKGIDGKAEIGIHLGITGKRKTVVKAGSRISADVSDQFSTAQEVKALREQLKAEGALVDGILMKDMIFTSQSAAAKFLTGRSADGNTTWRTVDGDIPLKQLL